MLFPAVHHLGFQAGQAVANFLFITLSKLDTKYINARTIVGFLTDYRLIIESAKIVVHHIIRFPGLYKEWWWNLVAKDPLHVVIETIMLMSIVYMMLSRSTEGYKDSSKEKLTKREQEDLLWEWKNKTRAPLAPPLKKASRTNNTKEHPNKSENANTIEHDDDFQIVVQKQEGKWLTITVPDHWVSKESNEGETKQNSKNEPKAAPTDRTKRKQNETELKVLNFCNFDFLGFQTIEELREASIQALDKYGCGSCGPRGFYGTIDVHLHLEEEMARFCRTDQAILYSDGASTCTSTVAAFAKRGDVLVVDEGVYEPLSTGVYLSRANVHWFRHNDMEDLERVLKELQANDKKLGRKPGAQRRFIVVEGLYKNLGTIAPLDEIVALKHKYKYRLMLDESFSFGTLGKTGRGTLEEHGKRPMYDAEITTIALENTLGSIGGVTIGNEEVVDHQRLSGAGYCYSASTPPFTATAAVASLKLLEERPDLVERLQSNVRYTYNKLLDKVETFNANKDTNSLVITSDSRSPIVVLQFEQEFAYEAAIMSAIMRECLQRGVAIVASTTPFEDQEGMAAKTELAPCIRMTVSALHTQDDTDKAIDALIESAILVTKRYPMRDTAITQ